MSNDYKKTDFFLYLVTFLCADKTGKMKLETDDFLARNLKELQQGIADFHGDGTVIKKIWKCEDTDVYEDSDGMLYEVPKSQTAVEYLDKTEAKV